MVWWLDPKFVTTVDWQDRPREAQEIAFPSALASSRRDYTRSTRKNSKTRRSEVAFVTCVTSGVLFDVTLFICINACKYLTSHMP